MSFKELLKSKNMTQKTLAEAIGVNQSTISQWCIGMTAPQRKLWSRLAAALDCTVEELLNCFREK